MLSISC